jgi:hypothetical protein
MKKIVLVLFMIFTVNLSANAVITPEETMSATYTLNHGYSDEMARLMDLSTAQINGAKPKYKTSEPDWYTTNKKVLYIRNFFMYLDSGLDDGKFAQHTIKYTERWNDSL